MISSFCRARKTTSHPKDLKSSSKIGKREPTNHKITSKMKKRVRAKKKQRRRMSLSQPNVSTISK